MLIYHTSKGNFRKITTEKQPVSLQNFKKAESKNDDSLAMSDYFVSR